MSVATVNNFVYEVCKAYRVPPEVLRFKVYVSGQPAATVTVSPGGRIVMASHWWVNVVRRQKRRDKTAARDWARDMRRPALIHKGGKP